MLKKDDLIFKKYKIIKILCKQFYNEVYIANDIKENRKVALKISHKNQKAIIFDLNLKHEAYMLLQVKGFGIPKLYSYGLHNNKEILVEEMLGKNIGTIFEEKNKKFEIKDICYLMIQIIDRLQHIHSKNIIHRDIKLGNFLEGYNNPNTIYLIDFGFAQKYRSSRTQKHIVSKKTGIVLGTELFLSLNAHKGFQQSRKDDLESLSYILLYLYNGNLPWSRIRKKTKDNIFTFLYIEKLLFNIDNYNYPKEIKNFYMHIKSLKFEEEPNYKLLTDLMYQLLQRFNINNDLMFTWSTHISIDNGSRQNSLLSNLRIRKSSYHKRLFLKIKERLSFSGLSNIDSNTITNTSNTNDFINYSNNERENRKVINFTNVNNISNLKRKSAFINKNNIINTSLNFKRYVQNKMLFNSRLIRKLDSSDSFKINLREGTPKKNTINYSNNSNQTLIRNNKNLTIYKNINTKTYIVDNKNNSFNKKVIINKPSRLSQELRRPLKKINVIKSLNLSNKNVLTTQIKITKFNVRNKILKK